MKQVEIEAPVAWRYRLHKTDGWTMTERELSPKELGPNGSQEPLYLHPPAEGGLKEPTEAMVDALADGIGIELVEEREEHHPSFTREDMREGIKAMLAAAAPLPGSENWLTPEEEAEIVEDINSGRWPYLQGEEGFK